MNCFARAPRGAGRCPLAGRRSARQVLSWRLRAIRGRPRRGCCAQCGLQRAGGQGDPSGTWFLCALHEPARVPSSRLPASWKHLTFMPSRDQQRGLPRRAIDLGLRTDMCGALGGLGGHPTLRRCCQVGAWAALRPKQAKHHSGPENVFVRVRARAQVVRRRGQVAGAQQVSCAPVRQEERAHGQARSEASAGPPTLIVTCDTLLRSPQIQSRIVARHVAQAADR